MAYPNISAEDSTFNVELTENNHAEEAPQRRQIGFEGYQKSSTPRKSTESAKLINDDEDKPRPRLDTAERVSISHYVCCIYFLNFSISQMCIAVNAATPISKYREIMAELFKTSFFIKIA